MQMRNEQSSRPTDNSQLTSAKRPTEESPERDLMRRDVRRPRTSGVPDADINNPFPVIPPTVQNPVPRPSAFLAPSPVLLPHGGRPAQPLRRNHDNSFFSPFTVSTAHTFQPPPAFLSPPAPYAPYAPHAQPQFSWDNEDDAFRPRFTAGLNRIDRPFPAQQQRSSSGPFYSTFTAAPTGTPQPFREQNDDEDTFRPRFTAGLSRINRPFPTQQQMPGRSSSGSFYSSFAAAPTGTPQPSRAQTFGQNMNTPYAASNLPPGLDLSQLLAQAQQIHPVVASQVAEEGTLDMESESDPAHTDQGGTATRPYQDFGNDGPAPPALSTLPPPTRTNGRLPLFNRRSGDASALYPNTNLRHPSRNEGSAPVTNHEDRENIDPNTAQGRALHAERAVRSPFVPSRETVVPANTLMASNAPEPHNYNHRRGSNIFNDPGTRQLTVRPSFPPDQNSPTHNTINLRIASLERDERGAPLRFDTLRMRTDRRFGPELLFFCEVRGKRYRYDWNFVYWFSDPTLENPRHETGVVLKWDMKPEDFDRVSPNMSTSPHVKMENGDIIEIVQIQDPMLQRLPTTQIDVDALENAHLAYTAIRLRDAFTYRGVEAAYRHVRIHNQRLQDENNLLKKESEGLRKENEALRRERAELRGMPNSQLLCDEHSNGAGRTPTEIDHNAEMTDAPGNPEAPQQRHVSPAEITRTPSNASDMVASANPAQPAFTSVQAISNESTLLTDEHAANVESVKATPPDSDIDDGEITLSHNADSEPDKMIE